MARRTLTETVAANVSDAIAATGNTPMSVAQATNIPLPLLEERLSAVSPFEFGELASVGGFLSLRWSSLFEGASA